MGAGLTQQDWTPEAMRQAQDVICSQIALGKGLVAILSAEPMMPSQGTFYRWLEADHELRERYALAREQQADTLADQIDEIADTETDPQRARNRIDARKWKAGKLRPKVYGDRLQLDGDLNVTLTESQLESRLAHLLGKAGAVAALGGEGAASEAPQIPLALPADGPSEA